MSNEHRFVDDPPDTTDDPDGDAPAGSSPSTRPTAFPHNAPATQKNSRDRQSVDLMSGPPGRTLWKLAIPLAFGFIVNAVYSWTDMYFISRLGDTATAALGFSDQLMFVTFTLGSGFCMGVGIVVARRIGEGRRRQAEVVATQALSFVTVYTVALALMISQLLPAVCDFLGLSGELREQAILYMSALLVGLPANLVTFQLSAVLRSTGNTVFPMTVLIVSALANALLDPVLIFGRLGMPALGIQGAGISTASAQWLGALMSLYAVYSGKLNIRLYRPTLKFDWHVIRTIFAIGLPASLQGLAVSSTRVIIISIANMFGTAAAAAYTIGVKVDILVFMPVFAAGIAIETLVGQSIGAQRFDRVKIFRQAAIKHLGGVMLAAGAIIYLFAEPIARTFTDDVQVIDLTVDYLHIAVFGYLFFSIGQTGTRSLSGAGHSLRSMLIIAGMLMLFQIPLSYVLSQYTPLGVSGVFIGISLGYVAFAVISSLAVRGDRWMLKKV